MTVARDDKAADIDRAVSIAVEHVWDGTIFDMPTKLIGHVKKVNESTLDRFRIRLKKVYVSHERAANAAAEIDVVQVGQELLRDLEGKRGGNQIARRA